MTRRPTIRWRHVLSHYACDTCLARIGESCVTSTGRAKYEPHAARSELARHDGWLDHEQLDGCANYLPPYTCRSAGVGPAAMCAYCTGPHDHDEVRW